MMRDRITAAIKSALAKLGITGIEPVLEFPADLANGDYATNVAMVAAKAAKKNPKALAEEITKTLGEIEGISKIEVAGPGFINFHFSREYYSNVLKNIRIDYGRNEHVKGYKVMVEYTDPNPFKEFHIGHLMSNAIGEAIARLVEYSGAKVVRANWQGDVGPHVAKAIWGKLQKPELSWGAAYAFGSEQYEANKEAIDALNKKIYEKSDPAINKLYDQGRKESLEHFEKIYATLGTKFDYYFFEGLEGLVGVGLVKEFLGKGVFEESDGAVVFKGEKYGLHTRVFMTARGLPTYEAKELGLNKAKFEKEPDLGLSVIITANEQAEYFRVVLKAMEFVMPEIAAKTKHISHGMMRLSGGKMSSRKGNVVTGESLIEEMREKALEKMKERELPERAATANMVAVAAIKYSILKQGTGKDIIFDPEQSLSFEGDSGPYLQYSCVRAMSVLEKAGVADSMIYHTIQAPEKTSTLERLIPRFPDIVFRAAKEYQPHYVTTYLTELAASFNSWYAAEKIIGSPEEAYKLMLTRAFVTTMKNGLWLLGISVPDKM